MKEVKTIVKKSNHKILICASGLVLLLSRPSVFLHLHANVFYSNPNQAGACTFKGITKTHSTKSTKRVLDGGGA